MPLSSRLIRLCLPLIASLSVPAGAAPLLSFEVGGSFTDPYVVPAVFLESVLDSRRLGSSNFDWAPDFSLGWIGGRDTGRLDEDGYTSTDAIVIAAAGVRFRYAPPDGSPARWFFSFQPALQSGRTVSLSSAYEFVSTAGWQGERMSVQLRHVSNASLHGPNLGETMLLVGVALSP